MDSCQRLRATYEFGPVDHLPRADFYIWPEALERWKREGMPQDRPAEEVFGFDEPARARLCELGWCEPAFVPPLEDKILQEDQDYQIVRDTAGRTVKFFKGRRHGFMPTYVKHAVAGERDWHQDVLPLLDPNTPERLQRADLAIEQLAEQAAAGKFVTQRFIGGYMYLRALVGPEEVCYMFVDNPGLIHRMMQAWLELNDAITARAQRRVQLDELFMAEDICYNHGLLISPDMVRRFLLPYYQQLIDSARGRNGGRRLHFHVDTDGNCAEAIELYRGIGMTAMSPFEVAADNDVVAVGRKYEDLVISGGIDKRVLAAGPKAIDEFLERIMPCMVRRGGYIPTCDHGVPDNVSFASYMHYRRRIMELDH